MDTSKFLNVLRRYLWLIVVAAIIAGLTTFFILNRQPRVYEAKTRLLVGPTVDSPSPDLNSLKIGAQLMQTYADLVTTRPFLESINNKLGQKINVETLAGMIDTKQNADTRVLTIIVTGRDPQTAVAIARAAADSLIEISPSKDNTTSALRAQMSNQAHQVERIINSSEVSIQNLEGQLATLGSVPQDNPESAKATLDQQNLITKQLIEERARLSDALKTLATIYQVLSDTNTNQLQVIEPAEAAFPITVEMSLRVAASVLAGLLLVLSIIFAYEYFDDTIRVPGDVTRTVKAPLLSTIERHEPLGGSGLEQVITFAQPQSEAANSYRTAVAKLLFSIGKSMPSSFMLSSVGSRAGEDTAMITANLSMALAQAGYRVVLVDAQFHNPVLTRIFDAKGKAGLYDLLTTKTSEIKLAAVQGVPDLQFLPAGLLSANWSGAMLNSGNIIRRIEELKKEADIVLVAGPSATGFAESLTLASQVSGVILVARFGEAHSKRINEVIKNLADMNIPLVGIIFEKNAGPFAAKRILKRAPSLPGTAAAGAGSSQIDITATGPVEKSNPS